VSSDARSLLVIGVGNRDRGDDAVGPIVCDLLATAGPPTIETLVFEGSVVDLPIHWSATDRVVIVDAAAPAGEPGRITQVDASSDRLVAPTTVSTHSVDVGAAVELARAIGRMPAALTIIGIEGCSFEFGAALTPEVRRSAERVTEQLARPPGGGQTLSGHP
jgi:hydrogenase maturation protease